MALQNQVYITPALAKQGVETRQNPLGQGSPFFAETDAAGNQVVAGGFGFLGSTNKQIKSTAIANTIPLGMVVFNGMQIGLTANCNINHGEIIRVVFKGCVAAKGFSTAATYGQKVFVNPTDGDIQSGNGDAPQNYVDTGWIVKTGNIQGEVVEIEKL